MKTSDRDLQMVALRDMGVTFERLAEQFDITVERCKQVVARERRKVKRKAEAS